MNEIIFSINADMVEMPFDFISECEQNTGRIVIVNYKAGRPPTPRAIAESVSYTPRTILVGVVHSVWQTQSNDWVVTLFAFNRNTLTMDGLEFGGYRTLNPNLGELRNIEFLNYAKAA
jgi:hypothetical protein